MINHPKHGRHLDPEAFRQATGRLPHPIHDGTQDGRDHYLKVGRRARVAEIRAHQPDYGVELANAHWHEAFRDGEAEMRKGLQHTRGKHELLGRPLTDEEIRMQFVEIFGLAREPG